MRSLKSFELPHAAKAASLAKALGYYGTPRLCTVSYPPGLITCWQLTDLWTRLSSIRCWNYVFQLDSLRVPTISSPVARILSYMCLPKLCWNS
jgi:hypothetical protein